MIFGDSYKAKGIQLDKSLYYAYEKTNKLSVKTEET